MRGQDVNLEESALAPPRVKGGVGERQREGARERKVDRERARGENERERGGYEPARPSRLDTCGLFVKWS